MHNEHEVRLAPITTAHPRFSGFRTRLITGISAGTLTLSATLIHPYSFWLLLALCAPILLYEWEGLNVKKSWVFRLLGYVYFAQALMCLGWLRIHPFSDGDSYTQNPAWVLGLFALIWTTDISAYLVGKTLKGPKIAPRYSPNKTISGLVGAIVCTSFMAYALSGLTPYFNQFYALIAGAFMAIFAQIGDIFESSLKRRAGKKDSGTLLPGHGGLLDRVDGLITVAPIYTIIIYFLTPA